MHPGELAAFIAYAYSWPQNFLCLIDTYDTLRIGVVNFALVAASLLDAGIQPKGVRIDSDDLALISMYFCKAER